jgi:hypothetical protein
MSPLEFHRHDGKLEDILLKLKKCDSVQWERCKRKSLLAASICFLQIGETFLFLFATTKFSLIRLSILTSIFLKEDGWQFFRGKWVAKMDGDGVLREMGGYWVRKQISLSKKGDQSVPLPRQKTH